MNDRDRSQRLNRISTQWTMLFQAHGSTADAATAARGLLLQRYSGAAYRYLLGAARDPDVAEELCQEFALRFIRGDFRRAVPERGRFRDYLKTALIHLVTDHHRARQEWPRPLASSTPEQAAPEPDSLDPGRDFLRSWREELLERTWKALAEDNPAYHAVLLARVQGPERTSAQLAEQLSAQLGKSVDGAWVRKNLQRAHDKFADLLLAEVQTSLEASDGQLREELEALDLLRYCRSALARGSAG